MSFVSKASLAASLAAGVNFFSGGEISLEISPKMYRQYPFISQKQKPCVAFLRSSQLDFPFSFGIEAITMIE